MFYPENNILWKTVLGRILTKCLKKIIKAKVSVDDIETTKLGNGLIAIHIKGGIILKEEDLLKVIAGKLGSED